MAWNVEGAGQCGSVGSASDEWFGTWDRGFVYCLTAWCQRNRGQEESEDWAQWNDDLWTGVDDDEPCIWCVFLNFTYLLDHINGQSFRLIGSDSGTSEYASFYGHCRPASGLTNRSSSATNKSKTIIQGITFQEDGISISLEGDSKQKGIIPVG